MQEKTEKRRQVNVLTQERPDLSRLETRKEKTLVVAGQSINRLDDRVKATGKLKFGADYDQGGFLHGKILRSPHPHALIRSINTRKAEMLEGVVAVLTGRDVTGRNTFGAALPDQPVICEDKVRFIGDGVALVAAITEKIAHRALALIEVEYKPLPAVFDPRQAIKEDSPPIHPNGNLLSLNKLSKGDVEEGFDQADVVLERTYQVPFQDHVYLEPDVTMAIPQPDGGILVEGPMQAPFLTRKNLAAVLGLPMNKVRVRQIHMGGGFGGKEDSAIDLGCRAAVLARHTGRPVRIVLEREEIMLQTAKRHPMVMEIRIGARADGTLTAFKGTLYNEQGAYASLGPKVPPAGGCHVHAMAIMPGPYQIPNCHVDAYLCYTNHPYGGAMRGFGAPQVHVAHEQIMDELAAELGMDPVDIRRKNGFKLGSETATGQILDQSVGLIDTLESCAESFDWDNRAKRTGYIDRKKTKRRGVGIGIGWYRTSIGTGFDACGANVHVNEDGSVLLYSGITEMGQGAFTVLPQICAEELGVGVENIRLVMPDTDLVPESGPTVGSRSTTLMGNAIILAVRPIKESLLQMASQLLLAPTDRIEFVNGQVFDRDKPEWIIPFREVTTKCWATGKRMIGQGWWAPPMASMDPETGQGSPYFVYSYSSQMAQVVVDVETGEVEIEDFVAAFDVGRAINPKALEGQIEGGVVMGMGYAVMEAAILQEGMIQNLSLQDYLIPTTLDVPDIKPIIVPGKNLYGPYGAKGVGEMPNIPTAPAILNAIANACGGRVRSLPADPEAVFRAVREAGGPPAA